MTTETTTTPIDSAALLQRLADGMTPDIRVRTIDNLKNTLWKQISELNVIAALDALERAEAASKAARAARGSKR